MEYRIHFWKLDLNSPAATINQEKQSQWEGEIALILVSDFIKADIDTTNCGTTVIGT